MKDKRFDESALREAMGEIAANYPSVRATYDVTSFNPDDPDANHVRVILHDQSLFEKFPAIRLTASGGMTILSGEGFEASQVNFNLGGTVISRDGTQTSANVGYTNYTEEIKPTDGEGRGPRETEGRKVEHGKVDLGFSQKFLWVRPDGTSLLYGVNLSIPTAGDAYPYVLAPHVEADLPFERFSHWGWLLGGNASVAAGGRLDGPEVWGNPYAGVRFFDRFTQWRVTGGPVGGTEGLYAEARASVDHRIPVFSDDERWNVGLHGRSGAQAGTVPDYRQFGGADLLGGPGLLRFAERSRIFASAGSDLSYTFANTPLGPFRAGIQVAGKCLGEQCLLAGGAYVEGLGARLGPEAGIGPDGKPYFSPLSLSMGW